MDSYVGKRIDGRYEIREIIGVGGMAVVYKAYDNIDDRIVAVKILKEEFLANEEFRRRFKNESKAIAVLSHPNIVKVYDVSFGDRLQYIVMEYVEGITLKEYIQQQGTINCREVIHFTTQVLKALQHAHDKGIVHRDIKPQNIILLQNGTIKVTDFGIARFSRSEQRTMTGNAIGSVHYISPEQARGEATDEKADIYSIGVLMYEMLTGQLPFQSDNAVSVALMQVQEEAVPPSSINSDIPTGLEQITMRAMQKNTRDRYQTAAEMLMDIEQYKKNPSIIFDYSYLVEDNDELPHEYAEEDDYGYEEEYEDDETEVYTDENDVFENSLTSDYESFDDDEDNVGKTSNFNFKKYLPILLGVVGAALIVGLVILLVVNLSGGKEKVQNFVGMNYSEIEKNAELNEKYNFSVTSVDSEDGDPGEIIKQDPAEGTKYKKGMTINLTIVNDSNNRVVPDVYGLSLADAKTRLTARGLKSTIVLEYSDTVDSGYVIRTNPKKNESIASGETVTVYVSDPNAEKSIEVPDIIGSTVEAAKTELESVDLELDENYEEVNSTAPAGTIVSCSPDVGEKATIGSKIKIKVSTGNTESAAVKVTFTLPSSGTGSITAKLNSTSFLTKTSYVFDGSNYTVTATGTGNADKLAIYVDDALYFSCTIDFTQSTPSVSSVTDNTGSATYNSQGAVASKGETESTTKAEGSTEATTSSTSGTATGDAPSYVSYYYGYAKTQLEALGYTVEIQRGTKDAKMANMVESQSCNGKNVTLIVYDFA